MKRVLIVGAGKGGAALLKLLNEIERMQVVAITDIDPDAEGLMLAEQMQIPSDRHWENWIHKDIDIVIEATGSDAVFGKSVQKDAF